MSRRQRSIPPSGAADGATKGGLPRKTRQPKPASSPRSSPATAAASGEFAVSRSAAVVAGVAVFVVAIVFLVPSERLSQGYDWFQNWRYHKEFLRSTVFGEGSIPLWCRWSFSGKPFLADPETQIFYPGTLLYVLLPASLALPLDVLTHFALAGIGMLLFCRQRGLHPWACLFGAIAYLACGFNLAHTTVGHIFYYAAVAWAPFVFLAVEGWVQTLSPRWIAAGAGALAVQYFAGALQVSWMTMAFGCLYGIGRAVERWWDGRAPAAAGRPGRSGFTLKLAGGLAAIFALGLLLAAAQLMPTLELASLSVREGRGYAYSASPSLPPAQATHMLAPALLKRDVLACEFYGYVGISVLALAGAALGAGMFRRGGAVFLVLGALAALMMLGGATPAFQVFYYTVPGLSLFRDHSREEFILGFCLTGLATAALDRVLVGPARNPRLRLALAGSAVGVCLAAVLMQLSAPSGGGSGPAEVVWLAAAVGSAAAVILQSPQRPWTRWALPGLLLLDLLSAERVVRDPLEGSRCSGEARERAAGGRFRPGTVPVLVSARPVHVRPGVLGAPLGHRRIREHAPPALPELHPRDDRSTGQARRDQHPHTVELHARPGPLPIQGSQCQVCRDPGGGQLQAPRQHRSLRGGVPRGSMGGASGKDDSRKNALAGIRSPPCGLPRTAPSGRSFRRGPIG